MYGTSIFSYIVASFQVLVNQYIFSTGTNVALPADCSEVSDLATQVISEEVLVFYFPFSQIHIIISSSFFLKLMTSVATF